MSSGAVARTPPPRLRRTKLGDGNYLLVAHGIARHYASPRVRHATAGVRVDRAPRQLRRLYERSHGANIAVAVNPVAIIAVV